MRARARLLLPLSVLVLSITWPAISARGLARVERAPSDPEITFGPGWIRVQAGGRMRQFRFSDRDPRAAALVARLKQSGGRLVLDAAATPVQASVEDFLVFSARLVARESFGIVTGIPPLDLDADGREDLFIKFVEGSRIDPTELWEHDEEAGVLTRSRLYRPEHLPGEPVTLTDTDGDGVRELLAADVGHEIPFSSFVRVLEQSAPGSFDFTEIDLLTTDCCGFSTINAGDLDGDHRAEVIYGDGYPAYLKVNERDDGGAFREVFAPHFPRGYLFQDTLVTNDLDDDGRRELLMAGQPDFYRPGRLTGLFLYEAIGDNRYRIIWNDGPGFRNFDALANAGDTDGDGRKEFLAASTNADLGNLGEQCTLYEYDGAGGFRVTWELTDTVATLLDDLTVASYDFDGDGRREILCYHRRGTDFAVDVYRSTGNDTYELLTSLPLGPLPPYTPARNLALGDFDRDQHPDLLVNRTEGDRMAISLFETAESYPTPPPVANLGAWPRAGRAPLTVKFSDLSDGAVATWRWDFGDGATSADAMPTHVYERPGVYAVRLEAAGPGGSHAKTRQGYITVRRPRRSSRD